MTPGSGNVINCKNLIILAAGVLPELETVVDTFNTFTVLYIYKKIMSVPASVIISIRELLGLDVMRKLPFAVCCFHQQSLSWKSLFSEADSRQVIFLFLFTLLIPSIHLNSSVYTMSTRLPLLRCLRTRLGVRFLLKAPQPVTLALMPGSNEINIGNPCVQSKEPSRVGGDS